MKTLIILVFTSLLTFSVYGEELPNLEIATYDSNKLEAKVGRDALQALEYGEKHRNSFIILNLTLLKLEERLMKAKNDEELKRVNLELEFIRKKKSAIQSLARKGRDRAKLSALITRNFSKKYAVIFRKGSISSPFHSATHANVKYVDITDEIVVLVNQALSGSLIKPDSSPTNKTTIELLEQIDVKLGPSESELPFVTLSVDDQFKITRSIPLSKVDQKMTWNIYRNGECLLRRNAKSETSYTYFKNEPGFYTVYVSSFYDGSYKITSNVIFYEVKKGDTK